MSIKNICTKQELREFTDNNELTVDNLSKFIETKTDQKYLIIQKDLVKDLNKQLFDNTICIFDIQRFLNDIWAKVVTTNRITTDKWQESLKIFDTKSK